MLKLTLITFVVLVLLVGGLWLNWQLRTPSHDRDWQPLYATLTEVEKQGETYRLSNIRNWAYGAEKTTEPAWIGATLDPAKLRNVYFIVEPFGDMAAIAHTMLAFEFEGGAGYVASVEARRTKGQAYGGLKAGILPLHEYMFVWATERDMYANSTFYTDDPLYVYRLNLDDAAKRAVLVAMLDETAALMDRPKFYNTFFSNCTNVLARAVNKVSPGAIPWNWSWHLPGYAAKYLHDRGLIDAPDGFEALKAHITPIVEQLYPQTQDPVQFSLALRNALWGD